ncbi:hypothetical protein BMS3Bbin04_02126 [bacterium BMS3Bbin04]|nr:hypothetical protein BMS3Bbin04_02126 [bacterium BMS3Bbin04]
MALDHPMASRISRTFASSSSPKRSWAGAPLIDAGLSLEIVGVVVAHVPASLLANAVNANNAQSRTTIPFFMPFSLNKFALRVVKSLFNQAKLLKRFTLHPFCLP